MSDASPYFAHKARIAELYAEFHRNHVPIENRGPDGRLVSTGFRRKVKA